MGLSPKATLIHFYKKDIIKPLTRDSVYKQIKRLPRKNWSLYTTKNCPIEKNLPKRQQLKNYYFHNFPKTEKEKEKYNKTFLSTDHISIHSPTTPDNKKTAKFLDIKGNFSPIRRSRPYVPTPHHLYLGNFSSVNYNIISNENNEKRFNSPKSMIDKSKTRMYFRKIGLSKYSDLERPINKHFNKEYKEEYSKNPGIFRVYRGIFSAMYDNAIRNGNIYPPFETKLAREREKKNIIN